MLVRLSRRSGPRPGYVRMLINCPIGLDAACQLCSDPAVGLAQPRPPEEIWHLLAPTARSGMPRVNGRKNANALHRSMFVPMCIFTRRLNDVRPMHVHACARYVLLNERVPCVIMHAGVVLVDGVGDRLNRSTVPAERHRFPVGAVRVGCPKLRYIRLEGVRLRHGIRGRI